MIRIRVLRNLGRGLPRYIEGQEVTVSDEEAAALCKLGLAEEIKAIPKQPDIKAVPPKKSKPENKEQS